MDKLIKRLKVSLVMLTITVCASAQQVAIKTNLLYAATTTPNIGIEVGLGKKSTAQLFYALNPWKFSENEKLRHWSVNPEYRYWFCHRFNGSFVGIHALGGEFNMGGVDLPLGVWPSLEDHRYEGWFAGGGVSYGYQWILNKHFNLEASLGLGYAYINYKKFVCAECGELLKDTDRHYFGPTKAALSVIYLF